jgi:hypothetical protein
MWSLLVSAVASASVPAGPMVPTVPSGEVLDAGEPAEVVGPRGKVGHYVVLLDRNLTGPRVAPALRDLARDARVTAEPDQELIEARRGLGLIGTAGAMAAEDWFSANLEQPAGVLGWVRSPSLVVERRPQRSVDGQPVRVRPGGTSLSERRELLAGEHWAGMQGKRAPLLKVGGGMHFSALDMQNQDEESPPVDWDVFLSTRSLGFDMLRVSTLVLTRNWTLSARERLVGRLHMALGVRSVPKGPRPGKVSAGLLNDLGQGWGLETRYAQRLPRKTEPEREHRVLTELHAMPIRSPAARRRAVATDIELAETSLENTLPASAMLDED